jgi:hypothetical protein
VEVAAGEAEEPLVVAAVDRLRVVAADRAPAARARAAVGLRQDREETRQAREPVPPAVVRREPVALGRRAAQARWDPAQPIAQAERAEAALKVL